jgi:hypothetical protein
LTASQAFWSLQVNYHAVNLALTPPYNTVRLEAVPLNARGEPLAGTGLVTFTTTDSTVSVDSTGVVTAQYKTKNVNNPTFVVAHLQYQNVTLTDTVAIQVTSIPPAAPLATFVLQPSPQASTTCNLNVGGSPLIENCGPLVVYATDELGDTLANASLRSILIAYESSKPLVARVASSGKITESDTGHVVLSASTWAYGVLMSDSLPFAISWSRYTNIGIRRITPVGSLTPELVFGPPVAINVGGTVAWQNNYQDPIDIVFDDSTAIAEGCFVLRCGVLPSTGTGNVPPFYYDDTETDTSAFSLGFIARSFPVAGIYHYHSRLYPSSTGVIYVREGLSPRV